MKPGRLSPSDLRHAMAAPRSDGILTSSHVVVRKLNTHYRHTIAANDGMPIVCVHGLAVSHRYLVPLARALAGTHTVYVPDLPGFGLAAKPPSAAYDAAQHAEHLAAWLQALDLPQACVVGHSFGAEVAASLAADHPHTVAALVLAGPTSDPAARSRLGLIARFIRDVPWEAVLQAPILLRDIANAGPPRVWATLTHSVRNRIERDLARVTAPTMVIGGARDPIAPAPWRDHVARLTRAVAHETVPHAAHNVATTAAPQVADLITRFVKAQRSDRRAVRPLPPASPDRAG